MLMRKTYVVGSCSQAASIIHLLLLTGRGDRVDDLTADDILAANSSPNSSAVGADVVLEPAAR